MLSACVNMCFAQQVSAYKGIKEYDERAIAVIVETNYLGHKVELSYR